MPSITRDNFIYCIEQGISDAGDLLSESSAERLREVGRTATSFGTNFDFDCPATQAGLWSDEGEIVSLPGTLTFACAFDVGLSIVTGERITNKTFEVVD